MLVVTRKQVQVGQRVILLARAEDRAGGFRVPWRSSTQRLRGASHYRRSEPQRGAIGAAGQPSQASDETLANRPRRKSRSAGWDASSSAIL